MQPSQSGRLSRRGALLGKKPYPEDSTTFIHSPFFSLSLSLSLSRYLKPARTHRSLCSRCQHHSAPSLSSSASGGHNASAVTGKALENQRRPWRSRPVLLCLLFDCISRLAADKHDLLHGLVLSADGRRLASCSWSETAEVQGVTRSPLATTTTRAQMRWLFHLSGSLLHRCPVLERERHTHTHTGPAWRSHSLTLMTDRQTNKPVSSIWQPSQDRVHVPLCHCAIVPLRHCAIAS